MKIIGFTGSVNLPDDSALSVTHQIARIIDTADRVYVGCALGVDALVIDAMLRAGRASDLEVFVAFGPLRTAPYRGSRHYSAPGESQPISNLSGVAVAQMAGATVHWWAGGGADVPLRGRLAKRSLTLIESLWSDHGELFAFPVRLPAVPFGKGKFPACGSGTWSTAAAAAKLNVPVYVLPAACLVDLPCLPSKNGGSWEFMQVAPAILAQNRLYAHQWTPRGGLGLE